MKSIVLILISLIVINSAILKDKVIQFPWYPANNGITAYSGYLNIPNTQRYIHYIFMQSLNSTSDPVLLWLNGGPGCSSMLGMIQEIGPYVMEDGATNFTQTLNNYTYLKTANLLFFESPPGVGFSTTNGTPYMYTDNNTASDNLAALQQFFLGFPEYKPNPFWISGESYGGIYIPYLASQILNFDTTSINFKGIMVGNGVMITNGQFRQTQTLNYWSQHNFFSQEVTNALNGACVLNPNSPVCLRAQQQVGILQTNINPYNVYGQCLGSYNVDENIESSNDQDYKNLFAFKNLKDEGAPCISFAPMQNYFNDPWVQQQLNMNQTNWSACSSVVGQNYVWPPAGSLVLYPNLFQYVQQQGFKILIYAGDCDGIVTYVEILNSISQLNLQVTGGEWVQWSDDNGQVAGFYTLYDKLTFTTVLGAGHMVPQYRRASAFHMARNFINNQNF